MKCLPPGYICVTQSLTGSGTRVEASKGTPTNLFYDYSDLRDPEALYLKLDEMATDKHRIEIPEDDSLVED